MAEGSEVIAVADLKRFVIECFVTIGVSKIYSEIMAEALLGADIAGHHSHGLYRLDKYIADAQSGFTQIQGSPKILKETDATAWVDGQNLLGPVVGNFCMKLAIEKAKQTGAAIVVANNSNNFGVASTYSKQAAQEGLIGLAFTNSSSLMLPTRAKYSITGTNPISFSAPGFLSDNFLLDMATTVTSGGRIQFKYEMGEYLPVGWAVNAACISETNADVGLNTGRFLPLGSYEEAASYKGTGLSVMVDILCGILGAAAYSTMVGIWTTSFTKRYANIGHCFIVINPKYFAPGFEDRMSTFMSAIRNVKPIDPRRPVRLAGDKRHHIAKRIEKLGGIKYPKSVIDTFRKLSETFKLKCVPFLPKTSTIDQESIFELSCNSELDKPDEVAEFESSDDILTLKELKLTIKDMPYMIQDPSEWCCPFSDPSEITTTENLRKKRQTLLSMLYEKRFKRAQLMRSIALDSVENTVYTKVDEIIETQSAKQRLL